MAGSPEHSVLFGVRDVKATFSRVFRIFKKDLRTSAGRDHTSFQKESSSINETTDFSCVVGGRDCALKSRVVSIKVDWIEKDRELKRKGAFHPPSEVPFGRLVPPSINTHQPSQETQISSVLVRISRK